MDSRYTRAGMGKLLPFPDRQHRAWVIRPVGNGDYAAMIEGELNPADDGPNKTGVGSLSLVRDAMRNAHVRRGLPLKIGGVIA
jgi:hypothetical protein